VTKPRRPIKPLHQRTLKDWLDYIESLHPEEIELGLDRIRTVFDRLDISFAGIPVITVAGTNGKGSVVAMLESIYLAAGYRVGSYTSPHLLHYNERVRLAGSDATDDVLCAGFEAVETVRGNIELTYFEFATLAALWVFAHQQTDVMLLETGLGGRLDAVNIIDADVAVITSIDIDHRDWLGDSREQIGFEKAGIFRKNRPAVCGDPAPPTSIADHARKTGCRIYQYGREFSDAEEGGSWQWRGWDKSISPLPVPSLAGRHQLNNAAVALAAVELLSNRLPVSESAITRGLQTPHLSGRLQRLADKPLQLLDVAHNPQSTGSLSEYLETLAVTGRRRAVLGMLKDKDLAGSLQPMLALIDDWYFADLPGKRGATAEELARVLNEIGNRAPVRCFADAGVAWRAALNDADDDDLVVAFGSFVTISAIMKQL